MPSKVDGDIKAVSIRLYIEDVETIRLHYPNRPWQPIIRELIHQYAKKLQAQTEELLEKEKAHAPVTSMGQGPDDIN